MKINSHYPIVFTVAITMFFIPPLPLAAGPTTELQWSHEPDLDHPLGIPALRGDYTGTETGDEPGSYDAVAAARWDCADGQAITHIRWWGAYLFYGKNESGEVPPPPVRPSSFSVSMYGSDSGGPFSRPRMLMVQTEVPLDELGETWYASAPVPGPSEGEVYAHAFQYDLDLEEPWRVEEGESY